MLLVVHVLIAPDSFKGTLPADAGAAAVAEGLRRARPDVDCVQRPVADGGEGTVAAALRAGWRPLPVTVGGPDGRPVEAVVALDGDRAVVELATAAGLHQLETPAPTTATTRGVGELVAAALDAGARRLVLGIGGSATTDGGAGMLQALGVRLLDAAGAELGPGGAELGRLDRVDAAGLDPRLAGVELLVASDVDNPLVGPRGAAAVFGPQKGATPADVALLDAALRRWADVLARDLGVQVAELRGAGGAGAPRPARSPSARGWSPAPPLVCDLVGLDDALAGAALCVTGEGALDGQTLSGKAPAEVARRARAAGVPCVGLAGLVSLTAGELAAAGLAGAHAPHRGRARPRPLPRRGGRRPGRPRRRRPPALPAPSVSSPRT